MFPFYLSHFNFRLLKVTSNRFGHLRRPAAVTQRRWVWSQYFVGPKQKKKRHEVVCFKQNRKTSSWKTYLVGRNKTESMAANSFKHQAFAHVGWMQIPRWNAPPWAAKTWLLRDSIQDLSCCGICQEKIVSFFSGSFGSGWLGHGFSRGKMTFFGFLGFWVLGGVGRHVGEERHVGDASTALMLGRRSHQHAD